MQKTPNNKKQYKIIQNNTKQNNTKQYNTIQNNTKFKKVKPL